MAHRSPGVRRVLLVVLDGLRADALTRHGLPHLVGLARRGAWTLTADTVRPSITAAAMTSLFTGVGPAVHGIRSDRFGLPGRGLSPLTAILDRHGLPSHGFMARIPLTHRILAGRIAGRLGARTTFRGQRAAEILDAARPTLERERRGLIVLHWPDADRAGHRDGWHSDAYADAARDLDRAVGALVDLTGADQDPDTLLVALADHGGGGADPHDHDSNHPDDTTIPVVLAGGAVRPGPLAESVSLLDVPATTLWALGVTPPAAFAGRPLVEGFEMTERAGSAAA